MFTSLLGAPADQGISPGIFSKRSRCSSGSSNAGEGDTSSKNRSVSFIPFLKRPQSDLGCNTSYRGAPPSSMSTAGGFEASFLSYPNLVDVLSNTTTEPFDLKSFLDFTEGHVSIVSIGWGQSAVIVPTTCNMHMTSGLVICGFVASSYFASSSCITPDPPYS